MDVTIKKWFSPGETVTFKISEKAQELINIYSKGGKYVSYFLSVKDGKKTEYINGEKICLNNALLELDNANH